MSDGDDKRPDESETSRVNRVTQALQAHSADLLRAAEQLVALSREIRDQVSRDRGRSPVRRLMRGAGQGGNDGVEAVEPWPICPRCAQVIRADDDAIRPTAGAPHMEHVVCPRPSASTLPPGSAGQDSPGSS